MKLHQVVKVFGLSLSLCIDWIGANRWKITLYVFGFLVLLFLNGQAEAATLNSYVQFPTDLVHSHVLLTQAESGGAEASSFSDIIDQYKSYFGLDTLFNIFIVFFVTLGPIKVIVPFVQLTENINAAMRRKLAFQAFLLSSVTVLLVSILGQNILKAWRINLPALVIGSGILIFLSSLRVIRTEYVPSSLEPPSAESSMKSLIQPLVFPTILTPYGIGLIVAFRTILVNIDRPFTTFLGLLAIIMVLNWVAMTFARSILKVLRPGVLLVLGSVLGVMQFMLGVQFILGGTEVESLIIQALLSS